MLQLFIDRDPQCLKDLRRGVMTSPDRLEATARRRLGLMPPEKGQVIILP